MLLSLFFVIAFVAVEGVAGSWVSCGRHRAAECKYCPMGHGKSWCHGDCRWCTDSCALKKHPCPVTNGQWSNWGEYTECSRTCSLKDCGDEKKVRMRTCNNPAPSNGGQACPGKAHEVAPCNNKPCEVVLLQSNVCFGAKDRSYGSFTLKTGPMYGLKLVHKSGFVSCRDSTNWNSNWGCNNPDTRDYYNTNNLAIFITDNHNSIVAPRDVKSSAIWYRYGWYHLPGYTSMSPSLEFSFPRPFNQGKELRIWYGEDFRRQGQGNNEGTACVDVYGKAVQ